MGFRHSSVEDLGGLVSRKMLKLRGLLWTQGSRRHPLGRGGGGRGALGGGGHFAFCGLALLAFQMGPSTGSACPPKKPDYRS